MLVLRVLEPVAKEILDMWFSIPFEPNETDNACIRMIDDMENLS